MGWIAALYLSDFLDRKLDKIQKPHRPIPSGRIQPKEALALGGIFAITGSILSYILSLNNFILVFLVAFLVLSYSYIFKSKGFFGNINRGFITAVAFLYGIFSIGINVDAIPIYLWLLALVFIVHDTNSNLVGAIRDIEGDKKGGYQTIPVKYGRSISIILSAILSIIWLSMAIFITWYYSIASINFYIMISLDILIIVSFYIYFFTSLKNYSRKKALRYHEFFVIERITLASAFIAAVIPLIYALLIYLSALILTIYFQKTLRKRYEFKELSE